MAHAKLFSVAESTRASISLENTSGSILQAQSWEGTSLEQKDVTTP
jgi:hypothetical protein